jgi:hypothetical protein
MMFAPKRRPIAMPTGDVVIELPTPFVQAIDRILCCLVNAVSAINRQDYCNAWLTASDLGRAVVNAETMALQMESRPHRSLALSRLYSLHAPVMCVMQSAPRPSPLAIAQARSAMPGLDRSAWSSDEEQWLQAREASGPLHIALEGDDLMLRPHAPTFTS